MIVSIVQADLLLLHV